MNLTNGSLKPVLLALALLWTMSSLAGQADSATALRFLEWTPLHQWYQKHTDSLIQLVYQKAPNTSKENWRLQIQPTLDSVQKAPWYTTAMNSFSSSELQNLAVWQESQEFGALQSWVWQKVSDHRVPLETESLRTLLGRKSYKALLDQLPEQLLLKYIGFQQEGYRMRSDLQRIADQKQRSILLYWRKQNEKALINRFDHILVMEDVNKLKWDNDWMSGIYQLPALIKAAKLKKKDGMVPILKAYIHPDCPHTAYSQTWDLLTEFRDSLILMVQDKGTFVATYPLDNIDTSRLAPKNKIHIRVDHLSRVYLEERPILLEVLADTLAARILNLDQRPWLPGTNAACEVPGFPKVPCHDQYVFVFRAEGKARFPAYARVYEAMSVAVGKAQHYYKKKYLKLEADDYQFPDENLFLNTVVPFRLFDYSY